MNTQEYCQLFFVHHFMTLVTTRNQNRHKQVKTRQRQGCGRWSFETQEYRTLQRPTPCRGANHCPTPGEEQHPNTWGTWSNDTRLDWRVKCALRGATILGNLCFVYIASVVREGTVYPVAFDCVGGSLMCIAVVYYKNFSIAVARLLLREVNVIVIIFTALSLFAIDCSCHPAISPLQQLWIP